jgi:hypothetical protein
MSSEKDVRVRAHTSKPKKSKITLLVDKKLTKEAINWG